MKPKKSLVVVNYTEEAQQKLLTTAKKVLGNMPKESKFLPCSNFLKLLTEVMVGFEPIDIEAKTGSKQAIADRRRYIDTQIRPLVNNIADLAEPIIGQDHTLAVLSGLLLRDSATDSNQRKTGTTNYKKGSVVYDFDNKTIQFSCIKTESARGYECVGRLYDADKWGNSIVSVTNIITFQDLSIGSRYVFKVRIINAKGEPGEWSESFVL